MASSSRTNEQQGRQRSKSLHPQKLDDNQPIDRQKIRQRLLAGKKDPSDDEPSTSTTTESKRTRSVRETLIRFGDFQMFSNKDPALVYCTRELKLTSALLFNRLRFGQFSATYPTLIDLIENMIWLHERALTLLPHFAADFAYQLKRFLTMVEQVMSVYDPDNTVTHYEWSSVGNDLIERAETRQRETSSYLKYIPNMEDFQLIQKLGAGGYGAVYNAIYKPTNHTFALKVVKIGWVMSHMEKMIAVFTNHPLVMKYHAVFLAKDNIITIMEHADAIDMYKYIRVRGTISEPEVRILAYQLVLAVEHLHLRGFIHMDIKPGNILLTKTGHVKLIDFDIGRLCIGHHVKNRTLPFYLKLTSTEHMDANRCGTWMYMPPEIFVKTKPFGRAVDWWSVGVVAYNMITGRHPFVEQRDLPLADVIIKYPVTWPRFVNTQSDMVGFVEGLLTKEFKQRLGSSNVGDIKNHVFFRGCDPAPWTVPVLYTDREHDATFNEIAVTASPRREIPNEISNLDPKEQHAEFTHLSTRFRRLVRHVNKKHASDDCGCLNYFASQDEPSDPINYSTPRSQTRVLEVPGIGQVPTREPIFHREWRSITINEPLDCDFCEAYDANGESALIISQINEGSVAATNGFCWGDIILWANDTEVFTKTDLDNEFRKGGDVFIAIYTYSITRLLMNPDLSAIDYVNPREKIAVGADKNEFSKIRYRKVSCYSTTERAMKDVMIVTSVDQDIQFKTEDVTYPGDIIHEISYIKPHNFFIKMIILPISLLRNNFAIDKLALEVLYKNYETLLQ